MSSDSAISSAASVTSTGSRKVGGGTGEREGVGKGGEGGGGGIQEAAN